MADLAHHLSPFFYLTKLMGLSIGSFARLIAAWFIRKDEGRDLELDSRRGKLLQTELEQLRQALEEKTAEMDKLREDVRARDESLIAVRQELAAAAAESMLKETKEAAIQESLRRNLEAALKSLKQHRADLHEERLQHDETRKLLEVRSIELE